MPRARKLSQPAARSPRLHTTLRVQDHRLFVVARQKLGLTANDVIRQTFDHARRSGMPLMTELMELAKELG